MPQVKIWQAPFRSLYSLSFYREVLESSFKTGLSYLALLSLMASVVAGIAFNIRSIPETREFVEWLKASAPPLTLTSEGLQMKADSPYVMKHPRYGPLVRIDLSKTAVEVKDFEEGLLLILTPRRAFFRSRNQIQAFDYNSGEKNFEPVPVTGEMYEKFGKMLRLILLAGIPVIVFFIFFLWKFMVAMVYSGFAVFINRFRREPLSFEKILNLCFFAMTPFVLIEFLALLVPGFAIHGGFFTGLSVTMLYLAIALLKTEVPSELEAAQREE